MRSQWKTPLSVLATLSVLVAAGCGGGATENPPASGPSGQPVVGSGSAPGAATDPTQAAASMATGWRYRFDMTSPPNDNFGVTTREVYLYFRPDTSAVHFQIENRLGVSMKVLWDEMSFRDVYGRTYRAVHRGITYDQRDMPQEPTWIQAGQRYADFVIPVDLLQVPEAAAGMGVKQMLPTDLSAQSLTGRTFGFNLVLGAENNVRLEFPVEFRIASVHPVR